MKWLIILCNLIIFSFSVLRAETDEYVEKCNNQSRIEFTRTWNCTNEIYKNNNNFNDVVTTVLEYSGDEASIHTLADKNCPIIEQLFDCSVISGDVDEDCILNFEFQKTQLKHDVFKAILNYGCANNATSLLRLLESNGFVTIYENKKFYECLKLINRDFKIPKTRTELINIIDLCNGVGRLHECYTNYVQDHDNKNLVPIANDLYLIIRQAIKCPSEAENLIN